VADDVGGRFAAHEKREGIDENGFACAGLSGEEIEARTERGNGVIDDSVVFSAELDEHSYLVVLRCAVGEPISLPTLAAKTKTP
jgi:hypothetical protein